jgi:hypothetical protein
MEEAVKELEFKQFYEVCRIFGVEVVDKSVHLTEVDKEKATEADVAALATPDIGKIKMRRDFENMQAEIVANYKKLDRRNRRQIDRIMAKLIWGNRTARRIQMEKVREDAIAAEQNKEQYLSFIKEDLTLANTAAEATESEG